MISYDEFKKTELTVGKILSAEKVEGSEKLLRLEVDFKEESGPRQIISGIAPFFELPEDIVGRHVAFVTNLEPRKIMGLESNGMILAAKTEEAFSLIEVPESIAPGTMLS